ncbi:Smyd3 [Symbiodinium pilosum]|uniref:Smyd3 protein n=1 Tax=Symbiodinium pilosum TaxID=2952 RepID=A0A812T1A1_SYMPI|nr:Smyd3 [Symbiodinium pilosum]
MPSDPQAAQAFKVKLQKETETSRRLALKALGGLTDVPVGLKSFLEPMGYAKLLGALCCNCTVVAYVSPVLQHILQVDGMQECPAKTSAVRALEPWIRALKPPETNISDDEAAGEDEERTISWIVDAGAEPLNFSTSLIPPFRGYAIFPRMALMNHSCRPSCGIEFDFSGRIFVLQQPYDHIKPGVELTISYLDSSLNAEEDHKAMGTTQRRNQLLPYGFNCDCGLLCKRFGSIQAPRTHANPSRRISDRKHIVRAWDYQP